jgi:acyl carrier protein
MRSITYDEVRGFLEAFLSKRLGDQGRSLPEDFSESSDLLLSGMIDSLGVLELMTALEEFCGQPVDYEGLDPDEMTVVGPLCRFVTGRSAASNSSA